MRTKLEWLVIPSLTLAFILCFWCTGLGIGLHHAYQEAINKSYEPNSYHYSTNDITPGIENDSPATSQYGSTAAKKHGETQTPEYTATEKLTVVLIVITVIQAVIYFFQWLWMKKALDHTRESSEKQLRAYVGISLANHTPPHPPNNFSICVVNRGQTPAHRLTSYISWRIFNGRNAPWPPNEPYPRLGSTPGSIITLFPQDPAPIEIILLDHPNGTPFSQIKADAQAGNITLYIYGEVTYFDVFGMEEKVTEFCYRHRAGTAGELEVCNHHNNAT